MDLDIFARQLRLIETITGNYHLTADDICRQLNISPRTFYRYLRLLRANGFYVDSHDGCYSISLDSPFYDSLAAKLRPRPAEIDALCRLLENAPEEDAGAARLKRRLEALYNVTFTCDASTERLRQHDLADTLREAIHMKRQVVLQNYESPHSQTRTDRLVEPFKMLPDSRSVRCYEPASQMCKTFKVARIGGEVDILPSAWQHKSEHKHYYTDLFGFSGEHLHYVTLRLSPLAAHVISEEYGVKDTQFSPEGDGPNRLLALRVCNFRGLARFVIGLLPDVQVVRGTEFLTYLRAQLHRASESLEPETKK